MQADIFGINRIAEFHRLVADKAEKANLPDIAAECTPVGIDSTVYGCDPGELSFKLIREELQELEDAYYGSSTKEEVLKEMTDLYYVIGRAVYLFGMSNVIVPAFNRTHDNNMQKITHGTFREDGKLVKAADHPKVNLKDLEY